MLAVSLLFYFLVLFCLKIDKHFIQKKHCNRSMNDKPIWYTEGITWLITWLITTFFAQKRSATWSTMLGSVVTTGKQYCSSVIIFCSGCRYITLSLHQLFSCFVRRFRSVSSICRAVHFSEGLVGWFTSLFVRPVACEKRISVVHVSGSNWEQFYRFV